MSDNFSNKIAPEQQAGTVQGKKAKIPKILWIGVSLIIILIIIVFLIRSYAEKEPVQEIRQPVEEIKETIEEPKAKTTTFGPISDPSADCFERTSLTETKPLKCGPSVDISSFEASQTGNEITIKLTLAEELPSAFTINQASKLTKDEDLALLYTSTGKGDPGFYFLSFILDSTGKEITGVDENLVMEVHIYETGITAIKSHKGIVEYDSTNVKIDGKTITITDTLTFDLKGIQAEFFLAVYGTELEGHDLADLVINKQ